MKDADGLLAAAESAIQAYGTSLADRRDDRTYFSTDFRVGVSLPLPRFNFIRSHFTVVSSLATISSSSASCVDVVWRLI